jgi:sterol desaturase/sphingolipid hydroxylase (fatty acid hydroxylase superfamily)
MGELLDVILSVIDVKLFVLCVLILTPLEALLPAQREKKILRQCLGVDTLHFALSAIFTRMGLVVVIAAAVAISEWLVPIPLRQWIGAQPIWLQVLLCTIIADLGFYGAHRMMHQVPWLWNFHAIHHSSEHLDWLAAFRVHPVDQVIVKGTSLVPVFVLGFSGEAIAIATLIYACQSLLIHSNIRIPFGWLKWLVASPEFHHWHHAKEAEAHNTNYSGQLPLWDMLFGTLHLPSRLPQGYGVDDAVPEGYADQLMYPFRKTEGAPEPVRSSLSPE